MVRYRIIPVLVLAAAGFWLARAGDLASPKADGELLHDEKALRDAGLTTDGPGLLEYFRLRTPSDALQKTLRLRAAQLGSAAYPVRAKATDELIRAGRSALPFLRETANHTDAELVRRAQYCIGIIEQNTRLGLSAPAARVLVSRNQPGTLDVLLAYLPFAGETWLEEEIRVSLLPIAFVKGRAVVAVEHMLTDVAPKRRAAAAWLVGQSSDIAQRRKAVECLTDESGEVRYFAAAALLTSHEPAAVPALIALLAAEAPELAWRAEDLLFRLAGDKGPAVWLDTAKDNNGQKVQAAWRDWWSANQAKIDWSSLRLSEEALGLTLVAENQRPGGGGRLYETSKTGDIRWQVAIQNPIDAHWLPGGRILVADSRASLIYEMDTHGVVGWKHAGISPTSVQRLPNGNTVCSTYQKIIEFTRDGKIIFEFPTQGHTYHARKLPDGHYIWIDAGGEIGEIDQAGKQIAKVKVGSGLAWGSVERLRNGRYLVALGGVSKVQEVDMSGKVFWERAVNNPNRAIRLLNGHTLVASHGDSCVYEFDANGNERWKHTSVGRPFAAHRR